MNIFGDVSDFCFFSSYNPYSSRLLRQVLNMSMNIEKHENALLITIMRLIYPLTHDTSTFVSAKRESTLLIIVFCYAHFSFFVFD
jgi:hypothetical protein